MNSPTIALPPGVEIARAEDWDTFAWKNADLSDNSRMYYRSLIVAIPLLVAGVGIAILTWIQLGYSDPLLWACIASAILLAFSILISLVAVANRFGAATIRIGDSGVECYSRLFGPLAYTRRIGRSKLISLGYIMPAKDLPSSHGLLAFTINSLWDRQVIGFFMQETTRRAVYQSLKASLEQRGWQIQFIDPPPLAPPAMKVRFSIRSLLILTTLVAVVFGFGSQLGFARAMLPTAATFGACCLALWIRALRHAKTGQVRNDTIQPWVWGVLLFSCVIAALIGVVEWMP